MRKKRIPYNGAVTVIKADTIYECLACGKEFSEDHVHAHEAVCKSIPSYLEFKTKQQQPEQLELW